MGYGFVTLTLESFVNLDMIMKENGISLISFGTYWTLQSLDYFVCITDPQTRSSGPSLYNNMLGFSIVFDPQSKEATYH